MKKVFKITILAIICMLALTTTVQAYKANFEGTPTSVNSEDTFTLKITMNEATTLASGNIEYDKSIFTFVEAIQENLSAIESESKDSISWNYTDLNKNSEGVKTLEFKFKSKSVKEDKTGIFKMVDGVFITKGEKTYSGTNVEGDKNIAVTIKKDKVANDSSEVTLLSSLTSVSTSGIKTVTKSTTEYSEDKDNKTTDKTLAEIDKLPQAGESTTRNIIFGAGIVLIVVAIIAKRKAKNLF